MNNVINVVNMHFIDHCNYRCFMCFARHTQPKELGLDVFKRIVDHIHTYFVSHSIDDGRINLVGGEPMLSHQLTDIIRYIHSKSIKVSMITNGSLLTHSWIDSHADMLDMIGVSIDAIDDRTNLMIGRAAGISPMNIEHLSSVLAYARSKGVRIKVNTVVSSYNEHMDFTSVLSIIRPDRYKLLQMVIRDDMDPCLRRKTVTRKSFEMFAHRHAAFNPVVEREDEIDRSYVMIDSEGYLFTYIDHKKRQIANLLKTPLETALTTAAIDMTSYQKRYTGHQKHPRQESEAHV